MSDAKTTARTSAIDIVDGVLRPYLGSLKATEVAVSVFLALRRAGLLKEEHNAAEIDRLRAEVARLRGAIRAAFAKATRYIDDLPDDAPQEVVIDICFHPLLDLIAALETPTAPGSST